MLFGGFRGLSAYDLNDEAEIDHELFQTDIPTNKPPKAASKNIQITYFYEKEPVTVIETVSCDHEDDELCNECFGVVPLTKWAKRASSTSLASLNEQQKPTLSHTPNLMKEPTLGNLPQDPNIWKIDEPPIPPPRKRDSLKIPATSDVPPIPPPRKRSDNKLKSETTNCTVTNSQKEAKETQVKAEDKRNESVTSIIEFNPDPSPIVVHSVPIPLPDYD